MATTSTAQTGGHRHNTLAHMAAIAQRTGTSSTPLPRISQGETEDISEVADVLTDLEVPEISADPEERAAVPEETAEFESTLLWTDMNWTISAAGRMLKRKPLQK